MPGKEAFKNLPDTNAPVWSPPKPKGGRSARGLKALVDQPSPAEQPDSNVPASEVPAGVLPGDVLTSDVLPVDVGVGALPADDRSVDAGAVLSADVPGLSSDAGVVAADVFEAAVDVGAAQPAVGVPGDFEVRSDEVADMPPSTDRSLLASSVVPTAEHSDVSPTKGAAAGKSHASASHASASHASASASIVDRVAQVAAGSGTAAAPDVQSSGPVAGKPSNGGVRQVNARLSPPDLHRLLREAAARENLYYDQLLVLAMDRHGEQVVERLLETPGVDRRRKGVWSEATPFRLRADDAERLDELCARLPSEVSLSRVVTALLAELLMGDDPFGRPKPSSKARS